MPAKYIEALREIRRRIQALPRKPDELGIAGEPEGDIARLYEGVEDLDSAGNWWVRSALEAEKYGQIIIAHQTLMIAARHCSNHLGIRRELDRIGGIIRLAGGEVE